MNNKQNELLEYEKKLQKKLTKDQRTMDDYTTKRQMEISGYSGNFDRFTQFIEKTSSVYKALAAIFFLFAIGLGVFSFLMYQRYESEINYLENALTKASKEKIEVEEKLKSLKHEMSFSGYRSNRMLSDAERDVITYNEDFKTNKNKWYLKNDENAELVIKKGGYYFSHKREEDSWLSWNTIKLPDEKNFLLECVLKKESGVDNYGYGVAWGLLDANNNYTFLISGDGNFTVTKYSGGKSYKKIPWTKSSYIRKFNETNKLSIKKYEDIIHFYINNNWVGSSPYEPLMGQNVGFKIDHKQAVFIKSIKVTNLIKKENVFNENFNNNNNKWPEKDNETVSLRVNTGDYLFSHNKNNSSWLTWIKIKVDQTKDFLIESEMVKSKGINNNGFGIVFGLKDARNCFFYQISGNGHYRLYKSYQGNYFQIIPWSKSPFINKNNKKNKLSLKKVKDDLNLYINGNFINKIKYEKFMGNGFGFRIDMQQEVRIENLTISKI
ncbi:MAG: hypothetical protein GY714_13345 [Desulfobacterales bacterium]|nr:hypothetical protein [Desulfobacterales bacterium]MCP4159548.1 hypothetical protein [Deltaproteobacteria bacterium]